MKDFGSLLKKLYSALNKETLEKESVLSAIKNCSGISLVSSDIYIHDGVIEITASQVVKNEIKLKEEKVLDALRNINNLSCSRILYR